MELSQKIKLFLQQVRYMCWKELLATFKDPRFTFSLIVPTIIMGFLFGYAANFNVENIPYVVVDKSNSQESVQLLAHLDGTSFYHRVATLENENEIGPYINSEDAMLAIVIPEDFVDKLERGEDSPVQLITDGRYTATSGSVTNYTTEVISQWSLERSGETPPVEIQVRTWYNPNQVTRWIFMAGIMGSMSFSQVIMLAGMSVAREREEGTFEQLLVTPASPLVLLIGKAFAPIVVGMIEATLLLAISSLWFQVPMAGSFLTLYFTLFLFFLSAAGAGLSISSICDNLQQVGVYATLYLMPNSILSGMATPVRNMPVVLRYLTYENPLRFALEAIRRICLEGAPMSRISYNYIPLVIIALVTLSTAGYLFRHHLN